MTEAANIAQSEASKESRAEQPYQWLRPVPPVPRPPPLKAMPGPPAPFLVLHNGGVSVPTLAPLGTTPAPFCGGGYYNASGFSGSSFGDQFLLCYFLPWTVAPTPPPCSVYDKACEAAAAGISAKAAQDGYRKWFDTTADWLREEQTKYMMAFTTTTAEPTTTTGGATTTTTGSGEGGGTTTTTGAASTTTATGPPTTTTTA